MSNGPSRVPGKTSASVSRAPVGALLTYLADSSSKNNCSEAEEPRLDRFLRRRRQSHSAQSQRMVPRSIELHDDVQSPRSPAESGVVVPCSSSACTERNVVAPKCARTNLVPPEHCLLFVRAVNIPPHPTLNGRSPLISTPESRVFSHCVSR